MEKWAPATCLGPQRNSQNKYIDHIIGEAGTFDVLKHAPVENGEKPLTDHGVVYADIKIIDWHYKNNPAVNVNFSQRNLPNQR